MKTHICPGSGQGHLSLPFFLSWVRILFGFYFSVSVIQGLAGALKICKSEFIYYVQNRSYREFCKQIA